MSTLTGENLYYAFNEQDCDAVPWGIVSPDIKALHEHAATVLHQTHIEPLQYDIERHKRTAIDIAKQLNAEIATRQCLQERIEELEELARDWRRYAQAEDELVAGAEHFHEELDVLKAEHANLKQRTRALAGEEVKRPV